MDDSYSSVCRPYSGKISDDTTDKISTYFYDLPTNTLRRNQYIFPAPGDLRIVSLAKLFSRTSAPIPGKLARL
ncbi:hypothetical protein B0H14DRAFT_2823407 [Mycena olivaceomarginata]|nr:hypothetical protein B0H14DRAFT_2823407 [Mycena olivaceomarginata]